MKLQHLAWGLLWACAGSSHAALGGAVANLTSSALSQREVVQTLTSTTATYRETVLTNGTVVHEYRGADSIVYAVTWHGPFLPDLQALLGTYFETLRSPPNQASRKGSAGLRVLQSDIGLIAGGHMGAFEGKAWIPAKLPAAVTANDLK